MKQALKMLMRDWRAGELRILAMALVVAVASITSVAFFADRVGRALVRDAHQLLGADLVLVSDHPWQKGVADEIARRGLEHAQSVTFISMAIAGDARTPRSSVPNSPASRRCRRIIRCAGACGSRPRSMRRMARRRRGRRAARSGSRRG